MHRCRWNVSIVINATVETGTAAMFYAMVAPIRGLPGKNRW